MGEGSPENVFNKLLSPDLDTAAKFKEAITSVEASFSSMSVSEDLNLNSALGRKDVIGGLNGSIASIGELEDNINCALSDLLDLLDGVLQYYLDNDSKPNSDLNLEGVSKILNKSFNGSRNCLPDKLVLKWGDMIYRHIVRFVPDKISPTFATKVFRPFAPVMAEYFQKLNKVRKDVDNFDNFVLSFICLMKYLDSEDDIRMVIKLSLSYIGADGKKGIPVYEHPFLMRLSHNFIGLINDSANLSPTLKVEAVSVLLLILKFWNYPEDDVIRGDDIVIIPRQNKIIKNCVELMLKLLKDKDKEVRDEFSNSQAIWKMIDFCVNGGFNMAPRISCVFVEIVNYKPNITDLFLEKDSFKLIGRFLMLKLKDVDVIAEKYDIDAEQIDDCKKSSMKILLGLLKRTDIDHGRLKKRLKRSLLCKHLLDALKRQQKLGLVRDVITAFLIIEKSYDLINYLIDKDIEALPNIVIKRMQHIKKSQCRREGAELVVSIMSQVPYNLNLADKYSDLTFMDPYLIETLENTANTLSFNWVAAIDLSWRKTRNGDLFLDVPAADAKSEYIYARNPTKARIFKYIGDLVADIFDRDPPCNSKELNELIKCMIEIAISASGDEELFAFQDLVPPIMGLYDISTDKVVIQNIEKFMSVIH